MCALLEAGARPNAQDKVTSPEMCYDYCADSIILNLSTQEGLTALILASQKGHTDVVVALVDAKADPNIVEKVCVIISHLYTDNSMCKGSYESLVLCYYSHQAGAHSSLQPR